MSKSDDEYAIVPTLIDTAGFYVANRLLDKALVHETPVSMGKALIFGVSDSLVRNGYITWGKNRGLPMVESSEAKSNAYIALVSFVLATIYDLASEKSIENSMKKNLIYNAIGFGSNLIIDKVFLQKYSDLQ